MTRLPRLTAALRELADEIERDGEIPRNGGDRLSAWKHRLVALEEMIAKELT